MAIEGGARAGLIAPDEVTFAYIKGRPYAPKGADWDAAVGYWKSLATDPGATYDNSVVIDAAGIAQSVTWGTSPEDVNRKSVVSGKEGPVRVDPGGGGSHKKKKY